MSYIPGIGSLRRGRVVDKVRTAVSASSYMVSPHWWRWWSSQIAWVRSIYGRRRDRAGVRRASPAVRSVRSQLRYCHRQLGANIGAQAVIDGIYDNAPGCGSSPQPGASFRRCNSCLHLPPSTTYLPLFGWMGFCFRGVLIKMFGFFGLKVSECRYLPPKDTR